MALTQLDIVTDEQLDDLVGADAENVEVGGCRALLGSSATAFIVPARDTPTLSTVWSASEFRLRSNGPVLPMRLFGPARQGLPVHLFFASDRGPLYLGKLRHRRGMWEQRSPLEERGLIVMDMSITPPVPRRVLERVRPVAVTDDLPGLGWLDILEHDRAAALEEFVAGWYGPPDPAAEKPPITLARVPARLAALYRLAHGRPHQHGRPVVLGIQNRIVEPDRLYTEPSDGSLVFGSENQGGFEWSLDQYPHGDDPTVWTTENVEPIAELEPLSGFLMQFSLHEAAMSAPYYAILNRRPTHEGQRLIGRLHRVPLAPARWYGYDMEFHVAPGLIAAGGHDGEDSCHFWLGASHRSALSKLADLDVTWQRFDG